MRAMARSTTTTGPPKTADSHAAASDELPLFRFGLKQLLAFVAALSALLTALVIADGLTATVLLLAALVVAAHVFSTALGSRLRAHANQLQRKRGATVLPPDTGHRPQGGHLTPLPYWHSHGRPVLRWRSLLMAAGIAVGGFGGGTFMASASGNHTSAAGILVGSMSLAVVGGWFTFLATSFYATFRRGWREAVEGDESLRRQHRAEAFHQE
jgi:hypothetical protein